MRKEMKPQFFVLITKYIKPGSFILGDAWPSCKGRSELGYKHCKINPSKEFVREQIHTQNMDWFWRDLKEWVKSLGILSKHIAIVKTYRNTRHQQWINNYCTNPSLSDLEHPDYYEESDSGSNCIDDMEEPQFGPTFH